MSSSAKFAKRASQDHRKWHYATLDVLHPASCTRKKKRGGIKSSNVTGQQAKRKKRSGVLGREGRAIILETTETRQERRRGRTDTVDGGGGGGPHKTRVREKEKHKEKEVQQEGGLVMVGQIQQKVEDQSWQELYLHRNPAEWTVSIYDEEHQNTIINHTTIRLTLPYGPISYSCSPVRVRSLDEGGDLEPDARRDDPPLAGIFCEEGGGAALVNAQDRKAMAPKSQVKVKNVSATITFANIITSSLPLRIAQNPICSVLLMNASPPPVNKKLARASVGGLEGFVDLGGLSQMKKYVKHRARVYMASRLPQRV